MGGVGVSNLKLMETVTILTTNHSHSRYHFSAAFISESVERPVIDAAINHSHEPLTVAFRPRLSSVSLEIYCKCRNS